MRWLELLSSTQTILTWALRFSTTHSVQNKLLLNLGDHQSGQTAQYIRLESMCTPLTSGLPCTCCASGSDRALKRRCTPMVPLRKLCFPLLMCQEACWWLEDVVSRPKLKAKVSFPYLQEKLNNYSLVSGACNLPSSVAIWLKLSRLKSTSECCSRVSRREVVLFCWRLLGYVPGGAPGCQRRYGHKHQMMCYMVIRREVVPYLVTGWVGSCSLISYSWAL